MKTNNNYKRTYEKIDIDALIQQRGKCKCCGKTLLDFGDIKDLYCSTTRNGDIVYSTRIEENNKTKYKTYDENKDNQWILYGKTINGKTYYRNTCWECYEKALYKNVDVKRKARKNAWYRSIVKNGFTPPPRFVSPNETFKYLFDVPEDELDKARAKLATASKKYWVDKLGEEAGEKRYNQLAERQAYTASTEYFVKEKGMTAAEAKEFHRNRACTIENFISRYGEEEGKKRWKSYCDQEAYSGNKLEYFIEKYGENKGRQVYLDVCDKKMITKENFIRKYGEEEGLIRWNNNITFRSFSFISQELFEKLDNSDAVLKSNSKYSAKNRELRIIINNSEVTRNYYADYAFFNKIIEFNGDVWHANPKKYKSTDFVPIKEMRAEEIWDYDKKKIERIENLGYKVKVVWESDYKDNPEKVIKECHEFLRS